MRKRIFLFLMAVIFMASGATAETLRDLQRRAERGEAEAQYRLGESYAYSQNGADYDKATAIKWFNKALDQGYKEALFDLGLMYRHDSTTRARAIECFELYIDYYYSQNNIVQETAANCLKELGVTNYTPGTRSRQGSSLSGSSRGSSPLPSAGVGYNSNGWISYSGPIKDFSSYPTPSETLAQLRREAESGNPRAQYRLGEYYGYGYKNTPTDNDTAIHWFTKALEQGYEDSYFDLALMYRSNDDKARAIYYFKLYCDYTGLKGSVSDTAMNSLTEMGVRNYKVGSTRGAGVPSAGGSRNSSSKKSDSPRVTTPAKTSFLLTAGFYNFSKILYLNESGEIEDYIELTGSVEVTNSYIRACTDDGDINCKFDILSLQSPSVSEQGIHTLIDKRGNELKAWTDSDGKRVFHFINKGTRTAVVLD